jgi:hypothetical protein
MNDKYGFILDIPHKYYAKADMGLATFLGTSFVWVPHVNSILTTMALGLGVFVGAVRAWKTWRDRAKKD